MVNKEKTDWGFVVTLLCIGLVGCTICYMGKYVNMLAERIDRLELEIISLTGSKQQKAEVRWHDKELQTNLSLPRHREKTVPSMFEQLGIDKRGNFTIDK